MVRDDLYFGTGVCKKEKDMSRAKPGETMTRRLKERETLLKGMLAQLEHNKQLARDKIGRASCRERV